MQKNPTRDEMLQLVKDTVTDGAFRRATFAGATRGTATEWVRVVVRPVDPLEVASITVCHGNGIAWLGATARMIT